MIAINESGQLKDFEENHVHYQRDITKELQELEAFENHVLYERNMATRAKMRCNIVRLLKLVKWSIQPEFVLQAWGVLKSHVSKFKLHMQILMPVVELILGRMVRLQSTEYVGKSWDFRWKELSRGGYDCCRGCLIDYGNVEYCSFIGAICLASPIALAYMQQLAEYFPSIKPVTFDNSSSNHTYCMTADVVECIMAILCPRVDTSDFVDTTQQIKTMTNSSLPALFNMLVDALKTIHYLDAFIWSSKIKCRQSRHVPLVEHESDPLRDSLFLQLYKEIPTRRVALASLMLSD